jgi:hypothetical protein
MSCRIVRSRGSSARPWLGQRVLGIRCGNSIASISQEVRAAERGAWGWLCTTVAASQESLR